MIHLSQLAIYPVKSCSQISLTQANISPFGLQMDRRWMVIDAKGQMITQRQQPRMCLIQTQLTQNQLILNAPEMPELCLSDKLVADSDIQATVWRDQCNAIDCGDEAAHWLSEFMQSSCRLVFFPDTEVRQCDTNFAKIGDKTAFSDGFPYLLIGQASLDELNQRLAQAIEMSRFRPNLVVTGSPAFAEDKWKKIRIGTVIFRVVKPCSRCMIPSINPHTAEKTAEPVKTLASFRQRDNNIYFGQNLVAENSGSLQLDMPVEILESE